MAECENEAMKPFREVLPLQTQRQCLFLSLFRLNKEITVYYQRIQNNTHAVYTSLRTSNYFSGFNQTSSAVVLTLRWYGWRLLNSSLAVQKKGPVTVTRHWHLWFHKHSYFCFNGAVRSLEKQINGELKTGQTFEKTQAIKLLGQLMCCFYI